MKKYQTLDTLDYAGNNSVVRYSKTSFGLIKLEVENSEGEKDSLIVDQEELMLLRSLFENLFKDVV